PRRHPPRPRRRRRSRAPACSGQRSCAAPRARPRRCPTPASRSGCWPRWAWHSSLPAAWSCGSPLEARPGRTNLAAVAVRVLITDDHPVVREGLEFMLGMNTDIELVGTAADGDETLRYVAVLRPDVIVMDMRLPGQDGAEVTAALKDRHPEVKVLILTAEADGDAL